MTDVLTWDQIIATEEYQADVTLLTSIATTAFGNDTLAASASPFLSVITKLAAIQRYYIRHAPDLKDIDRTPFIDLIAEEIGVGLPQSSKFPQVEFLRESKNWNRYKGSEKLYGFIGSLIGSPIAIHYPKDLIFTFDDPRSCLDGADSGGIPLDWDDSCMASYHDGVYWADYTYIVDVLQAQNVYYQADLEALLQSVHPAGTKRFLRQFFNYVPQSTVGSTGVKFHDTTIDFFQPNPYMSSSDGGFIFDDPDSLLDSFLGTDDDLRTISIIEIPRIMVASDIRSLANDILTHNFPQSIYQPQQSWSAFSRFVSNPDDSYTELFSDNDDLVMTNVTTNIGLSKYTYGQLKNYTWRHLKDAAWNNDKKNMTGQNWLPNLPSVSIVAT